MKEKKIKTILKKKVKEIAGLYKDIDKDFDKETIHNFRISVKTLRSFLRLLRINSHKPSLKIPKKFKRLYHIAGAIRDAQLEIDIVSSLQPGMPQYLNKLNRMLDRQKNEWNKYYSKKTILRLEDKFQNIKYETLHPDIIGQFFNDRSAAIDVIIQRRSPTDGQVHNVRKKIKDILYTAKLTGKEWSVTHKQIETLPVSQLDKIATIIGDYNDKRQMLERLKAFSTLLMDQDEKETIKNIRNKKTRELKAQKKNIITETKKISLHAKS